MSGVSSVSVSNTYTDRELDELARSSSTSTQAAVNTISGHAGSTYDLALHGRDATADDVKTAHQDKVAHEWRTMPANEGGDAVAEHGIDHLVEGGGVLLLPVTLVRAGVEMAKAVNEDRETGLDRTNAMKRDALHAFVLGNINGLPDDYVAANMGRYSKDAKDGTFAQNLQRRLGNDADHAQVAILQLHADQGMNAARAACDAKLSVTDYLRANPEAAKRYASDPAFRHGFDGVVFAHDRGPAQYKAVVDALTARDARYEQHHVQVRL